MTDEQRRPDDTLEGGSPWWSGSPRDVWTSPPETRESVGVGWPDEPGPVATDQAAPPRDPWAVTSTDTLGNGPSATRRPRGAMLVALAAVMALLAGVTGGAVCYLLADRDRGPFGFDVLAVGVGNRAVVRRRKRLFLPCQPSDRQIADRHPAARR